ncbi:MAG: hypothetical protein DMF73_17715 [Acidobacteria bacterium]|nr:MAG: hypothetical protein DMF73_17715 [Acidobacteriota bacterium]
MAKSLGEFSGWIPVGLSIRVAVHDEALTALTSASTEDMAEGFSLIHIRKASLGLAFQIGGS